VGVDLPASTQSNAAAGTWRVRGGVIYLQSDADRMLEGAEQIDNYLNLRVKMRLATLSAGVDTPIGLGATAIVPLVELWHDQNFSEFTGGPKTDRGQGDLELRLRQDVHQAAGLTLPVRFGATLGVVAPTGVYLSSKAEQSQFVGQIAASSASRELNIGRGVWWLLGELDAAWWAHARVLVHGSAQWRTPQSVAADGFGWGSEVRASVGVRATAIDQILAVGLVGDLQRRGQSTYLPDGATGARADFPNGGGIGVYLTPTISVTPTAWLTLSASYRAPLHDNVVGQQIVQGPSLFFAANVAWSIGAPAGAPSAPTATTAEIGAPAKVAEVAALVVKGKITIVDYWATWCGPCLKLGPRLDAFAAARLAGDVVIQRVDATAWQGEDWARFLPDAAGLPVLDVFGPDGLLRARLVGDDAERFEAAVAAVAGGAPIK